MVTTIGATMANAHIERAGSFLRCFGARGFTTSV
jgi:hypothetical protein